MCKVNKQLLIGDWEEGYALNIHVLHSIPLGENEYGKMQFNTTRTKIGDLVYELKYHQDQSKIQKLIDISSDFINNEWNCKSKINVVIPAPWSTSRCIQPVSSIAKGIATNLNIGYCEEYFEKSGSPIKNKNTEEKKGILRKNIKRKLKFNEKANVLIIDDLYSSGSTIDILVEKLREDINVNEIRVLTMTKTKNGN